MRFICLFCPISFGSRRLRADGPGFDIGKLPPTRACQEIEESGWGEGTPHARELDSLIVQTQAEHAGWPGPGTPKGRCLDLAASRCTGSEGSVGGPRGEWPGASQVRELDGLIGF